MTDTKQVNPNKTSMDINRNFNNKLDNHLLLSKILVNEQETNQNSIKRSSSLNILSSNSYQRCRSTSESGVACSGFTTPNSSPDQEDFTPTEMITPSLIYKRSIKESDQSMKVHGLSQSAEAIEQSIESDQEIQIQWQKTIEYYMNERQCNDYKRIEDELYQAFQALILDERELMIGLDSISSLKHLLITSMRICIEPNFKLEIRIGFGGTSDSLTLRTPSYPIAGLYRLERLLELRDKFSATQSSTGNIPTIMLINPPVLTFFSAWTAAVKANNLDEVIGKEHACDMLSYIRLYIKYFHSNLTQYIQYEIDHSNTYDDELLNRIIKHFNDDYEDKQIKEALELQGISRGSDKDGSIRYASMHLIIFKDIINKTSSHSLFHLLDEYNKEIDEQLCLYDCIITIGGSVEERFNKVRCLIQQFFINHSKKTNEEKFHFPLSIRMLSKCGQTPVYYHHKTYEITVDQILDGSIIDLNLTDKICKGIKQDLSILIEDIGINLLKSIWKNSMNLDSLNISSWKNIVSTLINLSLEVWRIHSKGNNKKCQCLIENQNAIKQFCEHYDLENNLNDDGRLILECILHELEKKIGFYFGQMDSHRRRRSSSICVNKDTTTTVINELDHVLSRILIHFVRTEFQ